jgi:hypothetical protein
VVEQGSKRGVLMGVFNRPGDTVAALRPGQIHTLLQLGQAMQRRGAVPAPVPGPSSGPTESERLERLAEDTRDVGLESQRRYFLQAWPLASVEVRDLHERSLDSLRGILPWPPVIRDAGFNLRTQQGATLIAGGGLRVLVPRWSLSLQPDGLLTWVVTAGSEFLAWASERFGRPSAINSIALVESTFEFVRLFTLQVLPKCEPPPSEWAIYGGMADLLEPPPPTSLAPGMARR